MKYTSRLSATGKTAIIELEGRFDAYEEAQVKQPLDEAIKQSTGRVVINLIGVNFTDSTALALLVQGMKHCREHNGDLHLCHLQNPIRVIFELTRLDKAFNIFATEDEAVKAFEA